MRAGEAPAPATTTGSVATTADVRDGTAYPLAAILQSLCKLAMTNGFRAFVAAAHTPRVMIDGLIQRRERWRLPAADVPCLDAGDAARRFAAARDWQREPGLPRQVFIRAPRELKPVDVDFTAPLTLDIAWRILKHERAAGSKITVSEMLPGTPRTWLADAHGGGYTSELRMPHVGAVAFPAPRFRRPAGTGLTT